MPEESYQWLPRSEILTFEETVRLVDVFTSLGVSRVRITGGEPLLRKDLPELIALLAAHPAIRDLALTTNGLLLRKLAPALRAAGLGRLTISLDTLRPQRFEALTRSDKLPDVLDGIQAAAEAGFVGTKLNSVLMRDTNDDELIELIEFARARSIEPRFIEYMDVGGATSWNAEKVFSRGEILGRIVQAFGSIEPDRARDDAPADRYRLPDGTVIGIIASTTAPFCGSCDRARITADGTFFTCLYALDGLDLKTPLRAGATNADLARRIGDTWRGRDDRGAEHRLATAQRGPFVPRAALEKNSRLEMHTRGG